MENIERQLDEFEALRAMFPEEEGCFSLAPAEQQALAAAQAAAAAGDTDVLLLNLSGTVKLPGVLLAGSPVSLRFQLPSAYPAAAAPQIAVECTAPRLLHEQLSSAMAGAAAEALGSESLLLLISRLQDEVEEADAVLQPAQATPATAADTLVNTAPAAAAAAAAAAGLKASKATGCQQQLLRVSIWFHHIKSTQKRKDIVAWARELNIGGYSKPGFPGVIVCEGAEDDVREYVARIRALQWQAMQQQASFLVGQGKGDITGPAADVNLMGYANMNQTAKGIHIRLYARAFVFAEAANASKRFMFVSIDAAMASQLVTLTVIEKLQAEFGDQYSSDNVAITATHTHASPGGFLGHMLYHITSLGFVRQSFDAMVDGIVEACRAAHADLRPAALSWSEGELLDANINRSPTAYANNPAAERAQYSHDVDKEMTVLKIHTLEGAGRALLSWFPVHPTSMNNTNTLISGDNKGAAEQFVEKLWAPQQQGLEAGFLAGFVQSNGADTSPNVLGTYCLDTGLPCDVGTSTCNGNNHLCHGRGPAYPDDTKSTQIIGQHQADKAQELWSAPGTAIIGSLDYRHTYIDMSSMTVAASSFTAAGTTCPGAMGYSFAAGTTDGPGVQPFYQADNHTGLAPASALVHIVNGALRSQPSSKQAACQGSKPILLNVGQAAKPYPWVPRVTEVALLRLGSFVIMCLPGEFTTMAGRRLRAAVHATLSPTLGPDTKVVLSTICNTYSSYVTTREEYQIQRYEGASTLYGPATLDAYIQTAVELSQALLEGKAMQSTAVPEQFENRLLSFLPPVVLDTAPKGKAFGDVLRQPDASYSPGQTVEVVFQSANPRNNLRRYQTFLEVQLYNSSWDAWTVVHTDDDWCTRYIWDRPKGPLSSESTAAVHWEVPSGVVAGKYRIKHYGDAKSLNGRVAFEGVSQELWVGTAQGSAR